VHHRVPGIAFIIVKAGFEVKVKLTINSKGFGAH
jgi:hypothetical protein